MPEPFTLTTLLLAGAAAMGTEAVKEGTKDAYRKLTNKVGELFGPRAVKAVAKLEDAATQAEGGKELDRYVGDRFDPDEATQIQPFVDALVRALKDDTAASTAAHARVGLDIEAGGNALIRGIEGAREIVAKVKADQDVTIEGFRMDTGRDPGK
ncbi:cytochrome P450 [Bradyrhizobium japonicum]|uniref:cytochrome P450 n=1 Tax=Bradyrhizobium japonicum TaxID=375 RepID=UPI0020A0C337|nr:cytochrome P450 [Bradyrhizobium japonicum]MCP1760992.1 hypothetical protein [Bradyrhizobium japonicum]MCP1792571.1 hypothetical protein [Bradyrhizobium japonicum]MCP1805006.1 hypothetical protein [Bradyrhizobium japonicum]MCP1814027.1 hypothetical protein [Bradyrhizobium japonicum]MCP1874551.1 hypothetical protein [Bradyrhizobium japonicum]